MKARKPNKHRGESFEAFLKEEGIYEEVERMAAKKVYALQLTKAIEQSGLSKSEVARRMHTSRAALDRILDEERPGITLSTLEKAAAALGRRLRVELVPA